jgi:hypothetical protein
VSDVILPPIPSGGIPSGTTTGSGAFSASQLLGDLTGNYVGFPSSSTTSLPTGTAGGGTGTSNSSSASSIWDILTDQSSLGTGTENPSTAASAVGTSSGTSTANTTANPGGTNPGGSGQGNAIWAALTKNMYNIFAVVLGVIFVIVGAVQMAKATGVSVPVE